MQPFFSSKNKFITGNSDHTVRLFVDCAVKKTRRFNKETLVGFINGEIVVATIDGKLSILNESLESKREFDAGPDDQIEIAVCIAGNETFVAVGYYDGTVRYWRRNGGNEPTVV